MKESSHFSPEKVAKILGGGRMSIEEKQEFLEEHQEKLHQNADFVSKETYVELFKRIGLDGKTVVNIGAGYALSPDKEGGINHMTVAISEVRPSMTLIPVDVNHSRTKSWLLLDTHNPKKNDGINLEPVTADATRLPFPDASIDGYLSANLINEPRVNELESDFVRKILAEAFRVIKPGGFLIVSSFGYVWSEDAHGVVEYNNNIDVEEMVPIEMVKKILEESGFDSIESIPLDQGQIEEAVSRRLAHRPGAVRAGVQDACAFYATKPL